ncbi:MAG: cytidine deaminase [Ignavibacteriae bacterium]|nr:cytidine deaminase [Ignavibacteriota bacterium]
MKIAYGKLIKESLKARSSSYSPYSKFKVGAAVLTSGGRIFTGANIECASYSITICAERVAAAKAVSEKHRKFSAIAISSSGREFAYPCGACLQFLYEFCDDMTVFLVKSEKIFEEYKLSQLLPKQFHL